MPTQVQSAPTRCDPRDFSPDAEKVEHVPTDRPDYGVDGVVDQVVPRLDKQEQQSHGYDLDGQAADGDILEIPVG